MGKKIIEKIFILFLISLTWINLIFGNVPIFAADDLGPFEGTDSITEDSIKPEESESIVNNGTTSTGPNDNPITFVWNLLGSIFGAIAGVLAVVINVFPMLLQGVMAIIAGEVFSIEKAAFNLIPSFNIDYFNFTGTYTVGTKHKKTFTTNQKQLQQQRDDEKEAAQEVTTEAGKSVKGAGEIAKQKLAEAEAKKVAAESATAAEAAKAREETKMIAEEAKKAVEEAKEVVEQAEAKANATNDKNLKKAVQDAKTKLAEAEGNAQKAQAIFEEVAKIAQDKANQIGGQGSYLGGGSQIGTTGGNPPISSAAGQAPGSLDEEEEIVETDQSFDISSIKTYVAKWFIILRLLAVALSLVILIYVGIRMALSTLAEDKAKYKKMLMAWVEGIVILFLMQYIIAIMLNIGKTFGNIIYDIRCELDSNQQMSFETDIIDKIFSLMCVTSGWNYVVYSIIYWALIFIQTKFLLFYLKRLITVGFLILIAPAVTITYPIDKIGDGKAQAFTVWFSELAVNILIQPIHALIYLVFMYTAGEIAKQSILVAAVFLFSLTKVEKYILHLFNLKNVVSLRPVDEQRKGGKNGK